MTPHPHVSPRSSSRHLQVRPRQHLLPPGEVRLRRAPPAQGARDQPVLVAAVLLPRHGAARQLEADAGARLPERRSASRDPASDAPHSPYPQALDYLSGAISIDARNPLARFKKAEVLISQGEYTDALSELTTLIEVAPKEGSVYFTLGKARASPFAPAARPALPCARARTRGTGRRQREVCGYGLRRPRRRKWPVPYDSVSPPGGAMPARRGRPSTQRRTPSFQVSRHPSVWREKYESGHTTRILTRTTRRRARRRCRRHRRSSVHACRHHHLRRRRAQVYKKLGDSSKAMVNFTRALDLSPKDAQQIKTAILNLEKEDAAGDDDEY